ncbi:Hypothetical predicted protein, partial [Olea europaea subsp. europaea]
GGVLPLLNSGIAKRWQQGAVARSALVTSSPLQHAGCSSSLCSDIAQINEHTASMRNSSPRAVDYH